MKEPHEREDEDENAHNGRQPLQALSFLVWVERPVHHGFPAPLSRFITGNHGDTVADVYQALKSARNEDFGGGDELAGVALGVVGAVD